MPSPRHRKQTEEAALASPLLRHFLEEYFRTDCLYDWGDDPSFFAATELLGDPRRATWGVCRRDVRDSLAPGDYVVFVCGRQAATDKRVWEYFYAGVATLSQPLTRDAIWTEQRYSQYRPFLNVLARTDQNGDLQQYEFVHKFHDDWRKRCSAPYWVFDRDDSLFNIENALHVATYDGQPGAIERWHTRDPQVRQLRSLLLRGAKPTRGLRSTNAQRAHPKLNLGAGYRSDYELTALRNELFDLLGV
jgi:hypothetical protein